MPVAFRPTNVAASLVARASPVAIFVSVVVLAATTSAEPPPVVTTPITEPPTPSPDVAVALWSRVFELSPSRTFAAARFATSPTTAVLLPPVRPVKLDAWFVAEAFPVSILTSLDLLVASTDVLPDETTPAT